MGSQQDEGVCVSQHCQVNAGWAASSQVLTLEQRSGVSEGSSEWKASPRATVGRHGGDTLAACDSLAAVPVPLRHALIYQFGWV